MAQQPAQAGYKIVNRIVDWITNDRMQLLNITDRVNDIVRKSGVRDGIVHLQSLHTTSAVFINEWQDALLHDVRTFFDQVVQREHYYRHNDPDLLRLRAQECGFAHARHVDGPDAVPAGAQRERVAGHLAEHHFRGVRRSPQPFACRFRFPESDGGCRGSSPLSRLNGFFPRWRTQLREAISLKSRIIRTPKRSFATRPSASC